jgi:nucleoside-diphosphate-sugar epimerase
MKALVIGGTGPTGPYVLQGLLDRGFEVTLLHRGTHEPDDLPPVEHIHADPHFVETLRDAIEGREFDVVIASYGRVKAIAEVFAGRCRQLIAVTGTVSLENSLQPYATRPPGMAVLAREDGPFAGDNGPANIFSAKVVEAERAILDRAADGAFQGTIVRYCSIYGARNLSPREWTVVKRILDGRTHMYVTEGGNEIYSRCAAENAAHLLLLAVDKPDIANGQAYNCGDEDQFSLRQWIDVVAEAMGTELDIRSLPGAIGGATRAELELMPGVASNMLVDTGKARRDLGYADVISAKTATADYVRWLIANPPQPGDYAHFIDRFDYAAEDRLWDAYLGAIAALPADVLRDVPQRAHAHPMPHPKKAQLQRDEAGR